MSDVQEALPHAEQAVRLNPTDVAGYCLYGSLLLIQGRQEKPNGCCKEEMISMVAKGSSCRYSAGSWPMRKTDAKDGGSACWLK
jgi:hypothetical protein